MSKSTFSGVFAVKLTVSKNIVSASKQEYSVVKIASATNAKTLMVLLIEESY